MVNLMCIKVAQDDERCIALLCPAFSTCKQSLQMMRDDNKLARHAEVQLQHMQFHWRKKLKYFRAAYGEGSVVELEDYGCVAMIGRPGVYPEFEQDELSGELTTEYLQSLAPVLESIGLGQGKKDYWYLSIIATDPKRQGQGLFSRMMRHFTRECDASNTPLVLEAVDSTVLPKYEHLRFEMIATKHFVAGKRYYSTEPEQDVGFACYYMVYWPEKHQLI